MAAINYPLTNVQIELMKLFNTNLSDRELIELKNLLSGFYADKAISEADRLWQDRGLTNDDMDKLLNNNS